MLAHLLLVRLLFVKSLIKAFENNISVKSIDELLVDILQKRGRLRFNNTNIVNSSATDFDYFSVHQRFYKFWSQLHSINFVIIS